MAKFKPGDFLRTSRNVIRTRFTNRLERVAQASFEEAKEYFLQEFDKHPLNRDLDSHAENSPILDKAGFKRRGSLFGFLGFQEGSEPVEFLRNVLNNPATGLTFRLNKANFFKRAIGILGELQSPSADQLAQNGVTFDVWGDGRAWPEVIEDSGVDNLNEFFGGNYGRSLEGYQTKIDLNPEARLDPIEYLSPLFKKTEKKFISILKIKARQR